MHIQQPNPVTIQNYSVVADGGRRLLSELNNYNGSTAAGIDRTSLGGTLGETWLEGPFGWPPIFKGLDGKNDPCAVVNTAIDIVYDSSLVLKKYYTTDFIEKAR